MGKGGTEVKGALILAFLNVLVNLKIYAKEKLEDDFHLYKPDRWYPFLKYQELFGIIDRNFENPVPVKEQVGVETIKLWFEKSAPKDQIKTGVDFLRYQTGEKGYLSCVRGEKAGSFSLVTLDEPRGRAVVISSTPFDRDMERGILLGGLNYVEKKAYVEVNNTEDRNQFIIGFH